MNRSVVREFQLPGVHVPPGAVLVPTAIADPVRGSLSCPAAPLIGGNLQRRGRPVEFAAVPPFVEPDYDTDGAVLFAAVLPQPGGGAIALAAAASPADRPAVAAARAAAEEWAAAAATRRLLLAATPWCQGARRALAMTEQAVASAAGRGAAVHIYGRPAADDAAAGQLADRGAVFGRELPEAAARDVIVFPAHGVPPQVRDEAAARGLQVIDATCPLVATVPAQAARLADRGEHVVIIGQPEHPAAAAIAGQAGPGGQPATVVASAAATAALRAADARRVSYLLQPGLPVDDAAPVAAALRSRFPAARGPHPDGFCYAASDRADSIRAVASGADLVLILGPAESADARQLAGLVRDGGTRAQLISQPGEITPAMLTGTGSVGVAESTAARAGLAAEVIAALSGLGPVSVVRRQVASTIDGQAAVWSPGAPGASAV